MNTIPPQGFAEPAVACRISPPTEDSRFMQFRGNRTSNIDGRLDLPPYKSKDPAQDLSSMIAFHGVQFFTTSWMANRYGFGRENRDEGMKIVRKARENFQASQLYIFSTQISSMIPAEFLSPFALELLQANFKPVNGYCVTGMTPVRLLAYLLGKAFHKYAKMGYSKEEQLGAALDQLPSMIRLLQMEMRSGQIPNSTKGKIHGTHHEIELPPDSSLWVESLDNFLTKLDDTLIAQSQTTFEDILFCFKHTPFMIEEFMDVQNVKEPDTVFRRFREVRSTLLELGLTFSGFPYDFYEGGPKSYQYAITQVASRPSAAHAFHTNVIAHLRDVLPNVFRLGICSRSAGVETAADLRCIGENDLAEMLETVLASESASRGGDLPVRVERLQKEATLALRQALPA